MSQTPRTDTYYGVVGEKQTRGTKQDADFASQLERELAEWKARVESAREDALEEAARACERESMCWSTEHAIEACNGCAEGIRALKNNAAQAAQNAAGQPQMGERKEGEPCLPAPAAPIADPQVPEVREAPGNRPIASSPASSALVSKEDVLAIIRGEKAAWNEPSNTAYTVCENIAESVRLLECAAPASGYELHVQFKTADLPKKQPSIIPDSGPSEAPCRHEWYQGTCAHCKIDADDYRASLRLAGRKP